MLLHLAFGLDHKAQADAVAQAAGQKANAEGTGIPERVEQTWAAAQFIKTLLRPREVVGFFARGLLHLLAQRVTARRQRLRLVQRLGADLTDMVDAHQRARKLPGTVRWQRR